MADTILQALAAPFPKQAVSWRAQSLTKNGDKAMALAYIDARDVMDRLDSVCGATNWQDRYEFHGPRTVCYLSIRIEDEWITKADGAGDSDVEAEKGAISDALKRAAVKWGIGRYLYALDAPWVPCETYDRGGKLQWKRWTADPWSFVRGGNASESLSSPTLKRDLEDSVALEAASKNGAKWSTPVDKQREIWAALRDELDACQSVDDLATLWKSTPFQTEFKKLQPGWQELLTERKEELKAGLTKPVKGSVAPNFDGMEAKQ